MIQNRRRWGDIIYEFSYNSSTRCNYTFATIL